MTRPSSQSGFTIIELLVALTIFAMLAAAGVLLLGNSVSAQSAMRVKLDGLAAMQRTNGAMTADLAQATSRITRTENGLLAPAFFSNPQGDTAPVLQFVRGGWSNIDGSPRPSLQKVEYWVRLGRLERRTYPLLDGARGGDPATLLDGVESAKLRFRNVKGEWLDVWTPRQPDLLPRAVEMTVTMTDAPPVTLSFLVGPGPQDLTEMPEVPDAT
jgi:general secretion pathway protein J